MYVLLLLYFFFLQENIFLSLTSNLLLEIKYTAEQ